MPDFWTHILGGELILNERNMDSTAHITPKNRPLFYFPFYPLLEKQY